MQHRDRHAHPRRWAAAGPAILALVAALTALAPPAAAQAERAWIRVNQLGYLPQRPKVAVVCALDPRPAGRFSVVDAAGRVVHRGRARAAGSFGPCAATQRLDFSRLRTPGTYTLLADGLRSPPVHVGARVYDGAADSLLAYMRQQRSGFNPLFRDSVHERTDGILVDHPRAGEFIHVTGGWADAADYLQYVTTSATATWMLLMGWRDHPAAFADRHDAQGLPGANGTPDVLDEARHGLEWLLRMYPHDDLLLNQLGDDRDHSFPDLPTTDSSDYGWGKGGFRPVYPCTGRPQGLFRHRNRSDGMASTAGKMASAFALGARVFAERDPAFAALLGRTAQAAYALGRAHPGVCQTAPARAPYFYEEENWADDMELAAAALGELTGRREYVEEALRFARMEPVTPWMGADTALHYQWYPWHNNGHHEAWRLADARGRHELAGYYRDGLQRVARRAGNGFRVGIPFIWCSNDLMASFATQAVLYRRMTGDRRFEELEMAALDWLFGTNPWGVSMVIGFPADARTPLHPHSIVTNQVGVHTQKGGLVDGPVYRSIFASLQYVRLHEPDEFAALNTGFIVYHDDFGDYSTNEPIMDGTANLAYLLSALAEGQGAGDRE